MADQTSTHLWISKEMPMHRIVAQMIVFSFVAAIPGGCGGSPNYEDNREAALFVLTQGGKVRVEGVGYEIDEPSQLPDSEFQVVSINLAQQQVRDEELERFAALSELKNLNLYGTSVTDQGLDQIAEMKNLTTLELSYTGVTDAGLEKLTALSRLEELFLHGTAVTKEGVEAFQSQRSDCKVLY